MGVHITEKPILDNNIKAIEKALSLGVLTEDALSGAGGSALISATNEVTAKIGKLHVCDRPAIIGVVGALSYANTVLPSGGLDNLEGISELVPALKAA